MTFAPQTYAKRYSIMPPLRLGGVCLLWQHSVHIWFSHRGGPYTYNLPSRISAYYALLTFSSTICVPLFVRVLYSKGQSCVTNPYVLNAQKHMRSGACLCENVSKRVQALRVARLGRNMQKKTNQSLTHFPHTENSDV